MFYDVDEIYHDGQPRRSGRYPWGSGAKWGKKKNDPGPGQRAKKEDAKRKKEDDSKRRKDESREAFRKRIRGSDDPRKIAANTQYFSDEELKQIANRMMSIADIKKYTPAKVNKVKNFFGHVENIAGYIGTGAKLYKNVMSAYNAVSGKPEGGDKNKDKNKDKKKN